MYSMIIVVIAIALAVLLAIATLYYGGNAFNRDSARLVAHTLVNQSGQIAAARQLARAEGRPLPEGSVVQMPADLLATMPVPPKGAYETGTPSAQDWEYYLSTSKEHFGLSLKLNQKTCMELNRSQGFIGIPAAWDGTSRMQCFGPTPDGGYTFLYELPTATPAERADAVDKAVNDAKPDAPTVRPGYPRLCPDGTTIDTGLCAGTGTGPETPPPTEEPGGKADGFWLVTAQVRSFGPLLESDGFSKNCPTGYIDPTSADATPAPSLPGDPLNVDSVIEMEWQLAPEYDSSFTAPLERKWCIPANEEDVADGVTFPDTNQGGDVVEIVNVASPSAEGVDAGTWTNSYVRNVVISANGVSWTMAAIGFTAETENSHNGDMLAMEGRKIGIGKTTGASHTYFVNSPTITSNGITYQNRSGKVTFYPAPPPCVPPVPNAPLGTGGEIVDIRLDGFTSVILKQDGSVWMSGAGWDYDFGNCSAKDRHVWTRVATGVASISTGVTPQVLMIKKDGSVWSSSPDSPVHVQVFEGPALQAESVGVDNVAVLKTDGTLWYSGDNWQAEAGNGNTNPTEGFVQVDSNVASISSSVMNIFYIKKDGSLWATGESSNYHLGGQYPRSSSGWFSTPGMQPLKLADGVAQVHGSLYATFYVKTDGSVYAAGNDLFRCGIFGKTPSVNVLTSFTRVAEYLPPIRKIVVSGVSVWMQAQSGEVYAAGCNDEGSFGDSTTTGRKTYTKVADSVKVFYGDDISFIVDGSNTLWAAGYNQEGQFGNGTTTSSKVFVPIQY